METEVKEVKSCQIHLSVAQCLGREDPLEEEMATHPSVLAWEIPWTEEPGGLQFKGLQEVGHDLVTEHAVNTYVLIILILQLKVCYFCFIIDISIY